MCVYKLQKNLDVTIASGGVKPSDITRLSEGKRSRDSNLAMEIAIQRTLLPMGHLQHLNMLLEVLELPDDLLSTVVLLFFPVLKNLYGSKSLGGPNWDN